MEGHAGHLLSTLSINPTDHFFRIFYLAYLMVPESEK